MKEKILIALFLMIPVLLIIVPIGMTIYEYNTDEEHLVNVDYTIYTNSGPVHKSENYKMRGEKFSYRITSSKGTNTVLVKKDDYFWIMVGDQYVCLYVGTSDVEINHIKIIE